MLFVVSRVLFNFGGKKKCSQRCCIYLLWLTSSFLLKLSRDRTTVKIIPMLGLALISALIKVIPFVPKAWNAEGDIV
jgi:hypothetical protein